MDIGVDVEYINALTKDGVAVDVGGRGGNGDGLRLLVTLLPPFLAFLADEVGAGVKKKLKKGSSWEKEAIVKKWEEKKADVGCGII